MNKLVVGIKVYLKPINNKVRYIKNEPIENHIKEYKIKKNRKKIL